MPEPTRLFLGRIVYSKSRQGLAVVNYAALTVSIKTGCITSITDLSPYLPPLSIPTSVKDEHDPASHIKLVHLPDHTEDTLYKAWIDSLQPQAVDQVYTLVKTTFLPKTSFLMPGFVDAHVHAPQYVFTGTGYSLPLLTWLTTYTFPRESEFMNLSYAERAYARVIHRTLSCGTTTACYYATIHLQASQLLADLAHVLGQRAFIGKINMDRHSPPNYQEETATSIQETRQFIEYIVKEKQYPLVKPIITPRFTPTCSQELLKALADISREYNLLIQSHISENKDEVAWVQSLEPQCRDYADTYDQPGLLNERTVMAHCIYLTPQERHVFKQKQVALVHCPSSNFGLMSGVMDVKAYWKEGLDKIGLGSDMAGGYGACLLDCIRSAIVASKLAFMTKRQEIPSESIEPPLTPWEAFYMATMGGAHCLHLEDQVGTLQVGKSFDALIVQLDQSSILDFSTPFTLPLPHQDHHVTLDLFPHDTVLEMLEKFIYLGDDRCIRHVFVKGQHVINKQD